MSLCMAGMINLFIVLIVEAEISWSRSCKDGWWSGIWISWMNPEKFLDRAFIWKWLLLNRCAVANLMFLCTLEDPMLVKSTVHGQEQPPTNQNTKKGNIKRTCLKEHFLQGTGFHTLFSNAPSWNSLWCLMLLVPCGFGLIFSKQLVPALSIFQS